ncbi:unnamed protein product [Hyaloperonospora brassicae]|uniref:BHLH domain-containing protein n=1 Tax=Hyaloperonospora brassicae TaxID=162125 RepID=A0AAV0URJ7_HYABA|nr:unnamed protein product [Hyaloperonospora brassicae]
MHSGAAVVVLKGVMCADPEIAAAAAPSPTASAPAPHDALVVSNDFAASVLTACLPSMTFDVAAADSQYHVRRKCDDEDDAMDTACDVSTTDAPKSRREKEAIRKRVYHQKVKDERNRLRQTVDDLSRQLSQLQAGKQSSAASLTDTLGLALGRRVARDEREKLRQAEAEQKRLLAEAKAKANCIEAMCQQLVLDAPKRAGAKGSSSSAAALAGPAALTVATARSCLRVPHTRTSPEFDYMMFRGHLRRVHESYACVDEIFDFDFMTEGIVSSVKRREPDGEIEYFEHRSNFTQPFCYHRTGQVMWELAKLHHRQDDREDFGEIADPENTLVVRFRLLHTLTCGSTVSVLQRQVGCRFVEKNRTIIVWKTHSEGEEVFRGMHADETGWVCLIPGSDEDTTNVMMCVRQVPMKLILSSTGDARVEEFHDLLQNAVSEDISEVTSELDKLLLEDTLAGIDI